MNYSVKAEVYVDSALSFGPAFKELTGHAPYPWQEKLFSLFVSGKIPANISLPTASGKTSIMAIWLLALAKTAQEGTALSAVPRRLVWIVNRRVVVDQATSEAEMLVRRLHTHDGPSHRECVRKALKRLSAVDSDEDVLAVSTLRGQFADNAEWRNDPSRPAIIVGTVDMIGSRLLFSGYGRGFRSRPLHAAFLGQDALLVHDESHLEPAFQRLIQSIASEQVRCHDFRPLRIVALSATSRGAEGEFDLSQADREREKLGDRLNAKKGIAFFRAESEKEISEQISKRALELADSGQAILIFLRKLEDVAKVKSSLPKNSVQQLTGTLRGLERDALARTDPIFARFMPTPSVAPQSGTVYLVCTSAGEVGINISGDHLICDLTPFDSMAQRFGRVNRFGAGDAIIDIVHPVADGDQDWKKNKKLREFEAACTATLAHLQRLPQRADGRRDASPTALGSLLSGLKPEERKCVFTPEPVIPAATDVLFDAWALTSVREKLPGRPPVAAWLHGMAEWEPLETYVAWRQEIEILTPELRASYNPDDLLEEFPLKPHELLRDRTDRVVKQLQAIAARSPDRPLWVVSADRQVQATSFAELMKAGDEKALVARLADCTMLLPPSSGGLSHGILDGNAKFDESQADRYDVGDQWVDEKNQRRRCRVWDDAAPPPSMRLVRVIDTGFEREEAEEESKPSRRFWRWYVLPRSADDDSSRISKETQELGSHLEAVQRVASALAAKLITGCEEQHALAVAAKWHDSGKRRELWQRSIGNNDANLLLAKSGGNKVWGPRTSYRHELGSLFDIGNDAEFCKLTPEVQDLALHLIAAHHGRARPNFPADEIFDPKFSEQLATAIAREIPRRFARVQKKYGRWGLAYLESILRAADILVSQSGGAVTSSVAATTPQEALR